ncbi:hypothetical protein SESBI_26380 [Sesbania bispinosa]|nr:hypothetical protein SESBI_26380 [Sesbania bispinosa]
MDRLDINEVAARSHSSTLDTQSSLTVPLRSSPEKAKAKPSQRKNKKLARERDLYKKNYLHACESLLSLMADKRKHRKTAILSLNELLTQCSAGIAGTGLLSVISEGYNCKHKQAFWKDEEMIQKADKSLREVYFRAAALLAVAVLRLA